MIDFYTDEPEALLDAFVDAVAAGNINTWSQDEDGDFTLASQQWRDKAWMRARSKRDRLKFSIVWNADVQATKRLYSVYHGRLLEVMLNHFDQMFDRANATAQIGESDAEPPSFDR